MQRHIYEYSIIRLNPIIERGESINVGVILYCRDLNFLKVRINLDQSRLIALFPNINIELLKNNLTAFENIVHGKAGSSPISQYDFASRFRWLTAKRSTMIQCGAIHSGLCLDAALTIDRLYTRLVLQ